MLCRKGAVDVSRGTVPVYLNVYDLSSFNGYAYWLGLGAYHSGIEVGGVEYAFGAHEQATSGIFEVEPKHCEGFTFRESILVGWTDKRGREVKKVMKELASAYKGNSYSLISRNCNHFCNDACVKLTGNPIPKWVNRLARIGLYCQCIIPEDINSAKLGEPKPQLSKLKAKKQQQRRSRSASPARIHAKILNL